MALRLDTINDDVLYLIVDHILALTNERDLSQARRRQMSERPLANFSLVNKRLRQLCLHRLFTVVYLTSTVPLILLRTAWIQRLLEAAYIRRHIKALKITVNAFGPFLVSLTLDLLKSLPALRELYINDEGLEAEVVYLDQFTKLEHVFPNVQTLHLGLGVAYDGLESVFPNLRNLRVASKHEPMRVFQVRGTLRKAWKRSANLEHIQVDLTDERQHPVQTKEKLQAYIEAMPPTITSLSILGSDVAKIRYSECGTIFSQLQNLRHLTLRSLEETYGIFGYCKAHGMDHHGYARIYDQYECADPVRRGLFAFIPTLETLCIFRNECTRHAGRLLRRDGGFVDATNSLPPGFLLHTDVLARGGRLRVGIPDSFKTSCNCNPRDILPDEDVYKRLPDSHHLDADAYNLVPA